MTVGSNTSSSVRFFVGAPVQNKSEYDCLRTIYEALTISGRWAYVFANFHANGRQIDLTVFNEKTTLVIEAKSYSLPVRGGVNGLWEQVGPHGTRKIGNAYNQALDAKYALRDVMQQICHVDGYPNGLVVNAPVFPEGSDVNIADFKVGVANLAQIEKELSRPSGALLTQDLCEDLAKRLGLDAAVSIDAALDDKVFFAARACDAYTDSFLEFYGPISASLIDDHYTFYDREIDSSQVRSMIISSENGVLIHGPSGCGKSLLAKSCAIASITAGYVPIFVSAKDFEGEFQRLLDKETVLLGANSARSLVATSKLVGKRIILFIDGYNECQSDLKAGLTRSLKIFAQRYGAGIVITTQQELERDELLTTKTVYVKRPTDQLKASLARLEGLGDRAGNFRNLLQVANSGLEACLVGQVGSFMPTGSSRFVLFDTYARIILGANAPEIIRVLSAFAEMLVHRACFSLSVREFDRLCDSSNLSFAVRQQLMRSQLLQARGDRISFIHELFFTVFTAEAAIRSANGDLSKILLALKSPRYFSSRLFIFGAIEDERVVHEALESITNQELVLGCARGECGATAKATVMRKIEKMLDGMLSETKNLRFQIEGDGRGYVVFDKESLLPNLANEFGHYLSAVIDCLLAGQYLDKVMAACKFLDEVMATFSEQFSAEAKMKKISLQHAMFSAAYVMDRRPVISQLINSVHSGGLYFRQNEGQLPIQKIRDLWARAETPSQFYFLIRLTKATAHDVALAIHVARLLQNIRRYPYHFQLNLIDFSQYFSDAEEPYRTQIIEALDASLDKLGVMMNSIIFEALKAFGTLEKEVQNYVPIIHREIQNALDTDSAEADMEAWNLYSRQFDHPFDSAYWEQIQALDCSRKKLLFTKACRGVESPHLMFLGTLIWSLSEFNGPEVESAIERWTILPDRQSFMPQDDVEVLISAHEALGRLGAELPKFRGEPITPVEHALLACAELQYWFNRNDLDSEQISTRICTARSILLDHSSCASAGALYLTTSRMMSIDREPISLVQKYPELCVAICRAALHRRDEQLSYFQNEFTTNVIGIACFAIKVLGDAGDIDDLQLLRSLCDHENYGTSSLNAIKKIEQRAHIRHA